ncbi:MAG TPA: GxxExxY protein [Polyangia bacterium]
MSTTEGTECTEDREGGLNLISGAVIGAAIEVHRHLGPGLLESAYESCLAFELMARGHAVEKQKPLPITYRGTPIDCLYRHDLVVCGLVVVEIKAVENLLPVHQAQILSYLKLSGLPLGLLINFHGTTLKEGVSRFRSHQPLSPSSVFPVPSVVKNS